MNNAPPTTHRITEFYHWSKEGRLILQPRYQRNPVWSYKNKSALIDTILNGLPVPEIYVQVKVDDKGDHKYEIVDGQQRIRAILEFIEGEYAILPDEETPEFRGKEFVDLPGGHKQNFWNYALVTRELTTNVEAEIKSTFVRLNKNVVQLNDQELRHGTYGGEFIRVVEELAKDEFWADNKIVNANDIKRMVDVEFVSELLIALIRGPQEGTKELDNTSFLHSERPKTRIHSRTKTIHLGFR